MSIAYRDFRTLEKLNAWLLLEEKPDLQISVETVKDFNGENLFRLWYWVQK